jgi:hypothetical protein
MAAIHSLFDELKFELMKVAVLNAFLDATIVFLVSLLVCNVFGIRMLYPLIIAGVFFVIDTWRYARKLSLSYIEEKNPTLREMLRTAADNRASDNLMSHALFAEVIEKVRNVSSGTFLNFQRLLLKIGTVFLVSAILISLAFFNVNIQKFENPLAGLENRFSSLFHGGPDAAANETGIGAAGDIYGEASIAKLGQQQLDVKLSQNLNQIDFTSVKNADAASNPDLEDYPVDVQAQASAAYTGGLEDVNDRKTAAEYSQEVKKD